MRIRCLAGGSRLDLLTEFERVRNGIERLLGAAGSRNDDRAVVKQAPEDTLVNPDGFDFGKEEFERVPANEADLDEYALVSDGELGGSEPDVASQSENTPDGKEEDAEDRKSR